MKSNPSQLVFSDLTDYPIAAQALDNQWVPPDVAAEQQTANLWDPQDRANTAADAELRRALANSGTLVVNRAFLLNTPTLYRNYLPGADARAALATLLNKGALIPYLYTERTPAEEPAFTCAEDSYTAWCQLVEQARPPCVRLSWDDEENAILTAKVNQYFASHVQHINRLNTDQLAKDLGILKVQAEAMRRGLLREIATWTVGQDDTTSITRNAVYQEFFTRPGTAPHQRLLREGEHIVLAKQLVDLIYNTGMPTLGGIAAYTPPQSPPRSTLQELRQHDGVSHDPERLGNLLTAFRGIVADTLQRGLDGPNSYADLSLDNIVQLRQEEEWRSYIDELNSLVVQGFANGRIPDEDEFAERTRAVAKKHAAMLRTARRIMGGTRATQRKFTVELMLLVPGMTVTVVSEEQLVLAGSAAAATAVPLVIRMLFRDRFSSSNRNLTHSITFPTMRLRNARKDLAEIIRVYRAQNGQVHTGEHSGHRPADQQAADEY